MFSNYEISDDLNRVHTQCLERKYGGRLRAHKAATKIQRTYRHYRLCQKWKQVVSQAPLCIQKQLIVDNGSERNTFAIKCSTDTSRGSHLRKFAQSQPSLKYQPMTSLTAQLRAERKDSNSPLCSPTILSKNSADEKFDLNAVKLESQQNCRPFIELASPRLSKRRLNFSICQLPNLDVSDNSRYISVKTVNNASESTTIVSFDSDHEITLTDNHLICDTSGGYHRSASPYLHRTSHNCLTANSNNIRTNNNIDFNALKSSPVRDFNLLANSLNHRSRDTTPNSMHIVQKNNSQMNWMPRKSENNMPYKSSDLRFNGGVVNVSSPVYVGNLPFNSSPQYQLSSANIISSSGFNYNANSLPRVGKKHAFRNEAALFDRPKGNNIAVVNNFQTDVAAAHSPKMSSRSNSFVRQGSPASLSNRRTASRDCLGPYNSDSQVYRRDQQLTQQQQQSSQSRSQMRGWRDVHRRRLYRIALNFFNKKPDRGIYLLIGWGFVEDNPKSIARLFLERRGLSKQKIGEFLGTIKSPFHFAILESFIEEISMYDMDIDKALRQLLAYFRLPGEAQKIDHIMQVFAKRYRFCNPERFSQDISLDTVYILAFAIIMLNTDLHTPSLKDSKRMKLDEFIKNIYGIEEGQLLEKKMLQGIYERVKEFEFRTGADHVTQVMKVDQSIIGKDKPKLVEPHRRLICYCRLNQVPDPNKKQAANVHHREVFLFNDIMIVAKIFSRKKSAGQYTLRYWTPLIGIRIESFQNAFYNFGLIISCPDGQELVFNAKNADDRVRFMADVRESVFESTEMEQLRIELELDKQNGSGLNGFFDNSKFLGEENFPKNDKLGDGANAAQRDSGLPELDQPCSSTFTPQNHNGHNCNNDSQEGEVVNENDISTHSSKTSYHGQSQNTSTATTFNITSSVASAYLVEYSTTSGGSNGETPQRASHYHSADSSLTPIATRLLDRHTNNGIRPTLASIPHHYTTSSSSSSNGVAVIGAGASSIKNIAPTARRLSFNSLDSGMVEENVDYSA